jgi:hypothetical protein
MFQQWLLSNDPTLFGELTDHLRNNTSCKSNVRKMMEIQSKLSNSGKLIDLVEFLRKEYPISLVEVTGDDPENIEVVANDGTRVLSSIDDTFVFKHYNPNLVTFPQKLVMQNKDIKQLEVDVQAFVTSKLDFDYVIVGDKAYIEYFKPKYRDVIPKIQKNRREVALYKARNKS